jgi:hypothetical protein
VITRAEDLMAARALAGDPMTDVMSHDYESMLGDGGSGGSRPDPTSLS